MTTSPPNLPYIHTTSVRRRISRGALEMHCGSVRSVSSVACDKKLRNVQLFRQQRIRRPIRSRYTNICKYTVQWNRLCNTTRENTLLVYTRYPSAKGQFPPEPSRKHHGSKTVAEHNRNHYSQCRLFHWMWSRHRTVPKPALRLRYLPHLFFESCRFAAVSHNTSTAIQFAFAHEFSWAHIDP